MLYRLKCGVCIDPDDVAMVRVENPLATYVSYCHTGYIPKPRPRAIVLLRRALREVIEFDAVADAEAFRDELMTLACGGEPKAPGALSMPIGELKLGVRARKCLRKLGIETVGQLVRHTRAELLEVEDFGVSSLHEILDALHAMGLKLDREAT